MPTRSSKLPRDPNQLAARIVAMSTGQEPPTPKDEPEDDGEIVHREEVEEMEEDQARGKAGKEPGCGRAGQTGRDEGREGAGGEIDGGAAQGDCSCRSVQTMVSKQASISIIMLAESASIALTGCMSREKQDSGQSKGGKERAKKLTSSQRSDIARRGAQGRWNLPVATHEGQIHLGSITLSCAVLKGGERVITETHFMESLGMYRSGALSVRRKNVEGGAQIPLFLAYKNLKPYIEKHLGSVHFEPLKYRTVGGGTAHGGIRAEIIPKICEIWMDAQKGGDLGVRQKLIAENAETILRGLARVGIVALIDEATGFHKAKDEYQKLVSAYIAEELQPWMKMFGEDYYQNLYRLKGWDWNRHLIEKKNHPWAVANITNRIIYEKLPNGVLQEIDRLNPADEKGNRKHKKTQLLSPNVGLCTF